jgi:hypothetical protein
VLVVVSTFKAEVAESSLPNYMCPREISILNSPFDSKSKDKGKMKAEDTSSYDHQIKLSTIVLNWTDLESDWIIFSDIPLDDPCIGTKMIDVVMRKYKKKGAQPVQEIRTEMYAKQREDETCVDFWQRIKRNAQGLRGARRKVELVDLADALKGALNAEHVYWMLMVDTFTFTLDELDISGLNVGQHVDQFLAKEHASSSSAFVSVNSKREIDYKLDNMTRQLETLSASLSSSQSPTSSRYEHGSR